jgi:hypothetical protein
MASTIALLETYLKQPDGFELEARYKGLTEMKRFEYFAIVRTLLGMGFEAEGENRVLLRIYANGCRVEVSGFLAIEAYCTNEELPRSAVFVRKTKPTHLVENDYGMRLALAKEVPLEEDEVQTLRRQWSSLPKKYRYLNRKRLVHREKFPNWAMDCAITKSSYANVYRFAESDLFSAPEKCEIEAEVLSEGKAIELLQQLKRISTVVIGGLQGTPYPVTHKKLASVLAEYQKLLKVNPSLPLHQQFVAPNPVALQLENLVSFPSETVPADGEETYYEDNTAVNVSSGYAVTDKADGVRKMLFVNGDGEMYFVTSRLSLENANSVCRPMKGTLLDGEFVEGGLYAVFDAYFFKGEDCRGEKLNARLDKVRESVKALAECSPYKIVAKTFYTEPTVQQSCAKCLTAKHPYTTDGLIFTPVDKPVGVNYDGAPPPNKAYTWAMALKWKLPVQTTIDFLVKVQEKLDGKNLVVLNVLYRGSKNWALPQTALLEQSTHIHASKEGIRPFLTEEDSASHLCYLNVVNGDMVTPEGEVVRSGDVVEFSYRPDQPDLWKWQPTKVRVDKETPNTYVTAYNNWNAIFHPIDADVLQGTTAVPDPHKYYVGNHKTMKELRQFHRYVKGKLLEQAVALVHADEKTASVHLIDLGVGQAGDLNRWRNLKISFVLGLDINRDNITNRQEGACIRYLTTNKGPMRAIFAVKDVSAKLFELTPPEQELDQLIVNGVFGKVSKASVEKYPNLALHYGVPFQITSCMFCIHYMFESRSKLTQFVDNVAEVTAVGGYFVGTAWDGKDVCALLRSVQKNESVTLDRFTITKRYAQSEFVGDPAVGYAIDVSQHTFHPTTEYLVDFQGLTTLLLRRGFKVVEIKSFRAYYTDDALSENEKAISFMNNIFIYQKIGIL